MWMAEIKKVGVDGNSWSEEIVKKEPDTYEWKRIRGNSSEKVALYYANELVKYFNDTRIPARQEKEREVVRVYKK